MMRGAIEKRLNTKINMIKNEKNIGFNILHNCI